MFGNQEIRLGARGYETALIQGLVMRSLELSTGQTRF